MVRVADIYHWFFPDIYTLLPILLRKELHGCSTFLDLGCGCNSVLARTHSLSTGTFSVGVEIFEPYLQESRRKQIHSHYIQADVRMIEFKPKSFDAVVAIELLEHLTKDEGTELLNKMKGWARKKIIITTPNGYISQGSYDGNPAQEHKSGWGVDELKGHGFRVFGMNGWKRLRGPQGVIRYKPTFLWTRVSDVTQKITYYYPGIAFQLLAVKQVKETNNR